MLGSLVLGATPGEIDDHFAQRSYLNFCQNEEEWSKPRSEMMAPSDMDKMIESFGVESYNSTQSECFLNNTKHPYASEMMRNCLPLMAPGSMGNSTEDDRIYASQGLMPFLVNGTRYSMCHTGMPCR